MKFVKKEDRFMYFTTIPTEEEPKPNLQEVIINSACIRRVELMLDNNPEETE